MKQNGRTTSIARRIAWPIQWKKLWSIFFQTALLGVVCVGVWCLATGMALLGSPAHWGEWYIDILPFFERLIWPDVFAQHLKGADHSVLAGSATFHMGTTTVDISPFLFWLCVVLVCLTILRLILWLLSSLRATARIRKYLKPIDDIAQATESISSHGFDESKFHSLEDAIGHLNGVSPDEQLHIGDDDLTGLETAVNNLLTRMHRNYRQQVQFVDDASHELRTPIAVIQGYADMLARWGKTDEKVLTESIQAIQTETEHMKTLVEQLLFLARGEAGRQELKLEDIGLTDLTREVYEEYQMIDPDHEYIFQADETPIHLLADEAMVKQAIRILTDNARKYSPSDTRITLRAYTQDGFACVDVQDNGLGIAREDVPRIFDRFYRADSARNSATGGSGLGLSIARWIVTKHGGRFQVTSYPDIGTRITILLKPKTI